LRRPRPRLKVRTAAEEENPVKKKNGINGAELERLNSDLFSSFDPEDEMWLVGGSRSITLGLTGSPAAPDFIYDVDDLPAEPQI
jgi:hypothetical protein